MPGAAVGPALQRIVPDRAGHRVPALVAEEKILAVAAVHRVVAEKAVDQVRIRGPGQRRVRYAALLRAVVVEAGAVDLVGRGRVGAGAVQQVNVEVAVVVVIDDNLVPSQRIRDRQR